MTKKRWTLPHRPGTAWSYRATIDNP